MRSSATALNVLSADTRLVTRSSRLSVEGLSRFRRPCRVTFPAGLGQACLWIWPEREHLLLAEEPICVAPEAISARVNPKLEAAAIAELAQFGASFGSSNGFVG